MTNADYIRTMSDEELAKFIYDVNDDESGWAKVFDGDFIPCYYLPDIVKWLKQPREVRVRLIDANAVRIHRKNIEEAPTIDAVPVMHGRWITSGKEVCGDRQYFCSACNQEYWETQSWPKRANYCPNCGADMREENRE